MILPDNFIKMNLLQVLKLFSHSPCEYRYALQSHLSGPHRRHIRGVKITIFDTHTRVNLVSSDYLYCIKRNMEDNFMRLILARKPKRTLFVHMASKSITSQKSDLMRVILHTPEHLEKQPPDGPVHRSYFSLFRFYF